MLVAIMASSKIMDELYAIDSDNSDDEAQDDGNGADTKGLV